jgi:hypothetical protein
MSLQCAVSAHLLNDFTPVVHQGFAALNSQLKISSSSWTNVIDLEVRIHQLHSPLKTIDIHSEH